MKEIKLIPIFSEDGGVGFNLLDVVNKVNEVVVFLAEHEGKEKLILGEVILTPDQVKMKYGIKTKTPMREVLLAEHEAKKYTVSEDEHFRYATPVKECICEGEIKDKRCIHGPKNCQVDLSDIHGMMGEMYGSKESLEDLLENYRAAAMMPMMPEDKKTMQEILHTLKERSKNYMEGFYAGEKNEFHNSTGRIEKEVDIRVSEARAKLAGQFIEEKKELVKQAKRETVEEIKKIIMGNKGGGCGIEAEILQKLESYLKEL